MIPSLLCQDLVHRHPLPRKQIVMNPQRVISPELSVIPWEPPLAKQGFHDVKSWIATFYLPSTTLEVFTTNKLLSLPQIFDVWSSDFAKTEKMLYDTNSENCYR